MTRVVIDANVLVSAIINKPFSVSQEIYQNFINKHFLLIVSPSILEEVEDVLNRDRVMKLHRHSNKALQKIINEIADLNLVVHGRIEVEVVRDPDDDKIISAAVEGKADYIVSRDKDLLDIKEYHGIKIISPEQFMGLLRSQ